MEIPTIGEMSKETLRRIERRTVKRHRGPKPTEAQILQTLEGRSIVAAARVLGYTYKGLCYVMECYGIQVDRKVTDEDIDLIVQLIDSGMARAEVAEKFERSPETISAYYMRRTGRYMPNARKKGRPTSCGV